MIGKWKNTTMSHRIVAFDLGNHVSGCAIADVVFGGSFDVVHMEAFENKSVDEITRSIAHYIDDCKHKVVILYENTYMFRNWALMRMQKTLKSIYSGKGVILKALLPSQKYDITSGINKKRKKSAVIAATGLLASMSDEIITKFRNLDRKHDVADALLMIKYVHEKPVCLEKKKK
jgi:hypothetical protein